MLPLDSSVNSKGMVVVPSSPIRFDTVTGLMFDPTNLQFVGVGPTPT